MSRFFSVIALVVAVGLAMGCSKSDETQTAQQPADEQVAASHTPQLSEADNAAATSTASEEPPITTVATTDAPSTPAESIESSTNEEAEPLPTEKLTSPQPITTEEIMLGEPELTSGVPGTGPLTVEEIKKWLDERKNHVVIKPLLPLGLAAAVSQIVGLDVNPLTRAKIELGRQLYFDTRLSKDNSISCASCHDPEFGYAKDTQFGVGVAGQMGGRNSPVAYNRILSAVQFWDGRAATLEEQAKGPIANPIEMSNTHDVCVDYLAKIDGYRVQFEKIFPDGVTIDNVAKAIASFERALVTAPSPWDYFEQLRNFENVYAADLEDLDLLKEDDPELFDEYVKLKAVADANPLDESAKRGGELFFSERVGCTACHVGANFTDELYHNIGVGMAAAEPDLGRYVVTKEEKDRGAFKTPTVRNVSVTGPYMHDGSQKSLEEVVEWYDKGGHPNPHLDEKIKKLNLNAQEKADLVAFMKALTGELPKVERGRLPE
jgi:cytochrome c peroxidase